MMKSKNNKLYEEGGLATDGVDVDPVSGNDVPPGSNAEDVRDDIPAQLSSGEYVVPADVVKYFGVAHFEKLRAKAKEGLEGMEEDGRMGGEPVDEAPQGVSDEDLMNLDGYATGGMVMKDSDVNSIIDRVKAAAKSDPSVSNLLKAKGIYMQDDNVGPEVKGMSGPRKFNEGGTADLNSTGTTSNYNPYTYTPGFSVESGTTGAAPTTVGAPEIPTVPTAPVASAPVTCPPGYVLDTTTNTCVPEDNRDRGSSSNKPQHDPEAWMKKYDYTDPAVLMEQSLDTLNMGETDEEKGFLEKAAGAVSGFFDNGIFGKIFKTQKHAEVLANAAVLESHGYTDQATKLREAAGGYAESNKLKLGGFFDSTTTLTKMAMGNYGMTEMMKGNRMASNTSSGDGRVFARGNKAATESAPKGLDDRRMARTRSATSARDNTDDARARRTKGVSKAPVYARPSMSSNKPAGKSPIVKKPVYARDTTDDARAKRTNSSSSTVKPKARTVRTKASPKKPKYARDMYNKGGLASKPTKK
jgi:hypothetical protein